jgi:hypothetical protein
MNDEHYHLEARRKKLESLQEYTQRGAPDSITHTETYENLSKEREIIDIIRLAKEGCEYSFDCRPDLQQAH